MEDNKNVTNINDSIGNDIKDIMENGEIREDKNDTVSKKKGKKKKVKKDKSFVVRTFKARENKPLGLLLVILPFAFVLDILRIIKNLFIGILVVGIISSVILATIAWIKIKPIYDEYESFAEEKVTNSTYADFKLSESSYIYDANGGLLAKLKASMDSDYIKYDEIPQAVVDAFVAIEDRTFWDNQGVDFKGIIRVLYNFAKTRGEEKHGASTITQQLIKNRYLTNEVSIERKAKEILIALKLSKKYTKQEIMEFYCNDICFANAFYGIQAASYGYFNKDVKDLTISEIAYLCAIPNSPEYYNPYKYPERALTRRNKILKDMKNNQMITKEQYNEAIAQDIVIEKPELKFNDYMTTYAIDCAVRYLMKENDFNFRYTFDNMKDYKKYYEKYNEEYQSAKNQLYTGGYKIYTTLKPSVQKKLQKVLDKELSFNKQKYTATGIYKLQGAITAFDNDSGKVIAVIGGRTQKNKDKVYSLNRAYQSYRQPGSTIKPLVVYTPALTNGYTTETIVHNISIEAAKRPGVNAQTLGGEALTLRRALELSRNGVAWQIFDKFGAHYCLSFMNKMKFSKICPSDYYDSSALGGLTYGVTTVEMAAAYATLENHGKYREATCIESILDRNGEDIYKEQKEKRVYKNKAADTMVDMMTGVLKQGTAAGLGWYNRTKMVAACKTGTTNNCKDGWLCGFTPRYTVAVWIGFDKPKTLSNLYGATYPGKVWMESMLKLIKGKKVVTRFKTASEENKSYDDTSISEETLEISDDLPAEVYEKYMPGRKDDEVLSTGYTVFNYRKDHYIADKIDTVIEGMKNSSSKDEVERLYNEGKELIKELYGSTITREKTSDLERAYTANN